MSKPKFTPGPWKRAPGFQRAIPIETADGKILFIVVSLARRSDLNDHVPLIAAAPELYEALESMVSERIDQVGEDADDASLARARAALAKARGEMP